MSVCCLLLFVVVCCMLHCLTCIGLTIPSVSRARRDVSSPDVMESKKATSCLSMEVYSWLRTSLLILLPTKEKHSERMLPNSPVATLTAMYSLMSALKRDEALFCSVGLAALTPRMTSSKMELTSHHSGPQKHTHTHAATACQSSTRQYYRCTAHAKNIREV